MKEAICIPCKEQARKQISPLNGANLGESAQCSRGIFAGCGVCGYFFALHQLETGCAVGKRAQPYSLCPTTTLWTVTGVVVNSAIIQSHQWPERLEFDLCFAPWERVHRTTREQGGQAITIP